MTNDTADTADGRHAAKTARAKQYNDEQDKGTA